MATLQQLETALIGADKAGDVNAARTLAAAVKVARSDKANQIPDTQVDVGARSAQPGAVDTAIGTGEAALSTVTGATGGLAGMIGGTLKGLAEQILSGKFGTADAARAVEDSAVKGASTLTYAPRTPSGQSQASAVADAAQNILPVAPLAGESAAIASAARAAGPVAAQAVERGAQIAKKSAGAVADAVVPGVQALRDGVADVVAPTAGGFASAGAAAVPAEVLRRQKAANLPVPMNLTTGAATREADQLAFEKEVMKQPEIGAPLRARAELNNAQAQQNIDALIDDTGAQAPDFAAAGNAVTKALAQGWKQSKAKTRVAYTAARKSPEAAAAVDPGIALQLRDGDTPVTLLGYLNSKVQGVPSSAVTDAARKLAIKMGVAAEDENGNLVPKPATVGQMEDFRRELSGTARYDDPTGIRDETILKKIVDAQTDPVSGPLYKTARSLRAEQARKYENRAIVSRLINTKRGTDDAQVYADQVFNRSVLNSSPDEITFLKRVLLTNGKKGQDAWRELQGATLKHIKDRATQGMGLDSRDRPMVSTAKLHEAVTALDKNGRLDLMLGKKNAAIVRDLNDIVRYVNTVPPGTLINNSGTAGTLMAAIAEAGATGALTGLPVPVLSGLRLALKGVKNARTRAAVRRALGEE